ncbi:MAG: ABC transporter permease [Bryobacterales bacterium]|nr:ABC transporter permease [Bryobacteraceae bacterium]MDW8354128.1 ABC transporter permease [Bryobacterales bacterium]
MSDRAAVLDRPLRAVPLAFRERSLVQLTLVRFREFWREPEAIFWVFIFPILLTAGLGIAFRSGPAQALPIGVTDDGLAAVLQAEPSLSVRRLDARTAEDQLRLGRIHLLVTPEAGGGVRLRYDDTNPESRTAGLLVERALQRAAGVRDRVPVTAEIAREPGSRYIDFVVPGLLGMNLMGSGMWGVGFAIVDARRKRLLKRLVASPMSRAEYLLSFLLSRLVLLLLEVTALVGFGVLAFGVPVNGPVWQLALLCVLASLCFSALGLLIASRTRTIEAASGWMNFVMLPMWVFSGVFFSYERFPEAFHPFIRLLPLTAAIDALRANMLQGAGLEQVAPEVAVMGGWLGLSFFAALALFRWR